MEETKAPLTIRNASVADAHAIAEIHVAGWRAAYRALMPQDYLDSISVEQRHQFWKGMMSKPGPGKVDVAEEDGAIVAFCSYGPTRDDDAQNAAEIYAIYVQPGKWRRGFGRALCERAVREAAERTHTAMTLWVLEGNASARRFYERLAYATDGGARTSDKLIGTPFTEVRYRRRI